ncbi:MAG: hypothetical protein ACI8RZ_004448 [Myxococcota bacterium]|jgi:hypothetical protein
MPQSRLIFVEMLRTALVAEMASDSPSRRMQPQVPTQHQPAFVIGADMSAILILDETGAFRALPHGDGPWRPPQPRSRNVQALFAT